MTKNLKSYLRIILWITFLCQAETLAAGYFDKSAPSMDQFLGELNKAQIDSVINARFTSKQIFKKRVQKIFQEQKGRAILIVGRADAKSGFELNQIFNDLDSNTDEKQVLIEKNINCEENIPNKELGQKLCSWTFEKMMDQALLDHGYSKFTSTVISNITVLEKQLFFTNDPNQEFVIIALPALSLYDGSNSYQSVLYNGIYFVVYKRNF